ncbi:sensor domain-containing diguanylate cyclase [Sporosarcina sp. Te-1]|uniref:sensor domain-containing diguanylate cyclase n=1 Tax=Sporosarcina sp. Te-1 TaxID=2818390 RepID=UPI001A9EE877|nr:sensor domain-containing diguanylate cyclase [Sporosarcina sp. Te-1]QTD41566.1 GGDEF domain-containing protein [Sporosarcina sp. Te-1]
MSNKRYYSLIYFFFWLLIVPTGLILAWMNYMPESLDLFRLGMYSVMALLTSLFIVKFNGKPISLTMWVTMAVFLEYGLFIEMLISQIALFATLAVQKSPLPIVRRYFINSTMICITSVVAAFGFYLVGGEIGTDHFGIALIGLAVYRLFYTVSNLSILKLYFKFSGRSSVFTLRDIAFEYGSVVLLLPMSLTLYFLLGTIGESAFGLIGIPYIVTVTIIRQYSKSERVNSDLKRAGVIGNELAGITDVQHVRDQFIEKVSALFQSDHVYLFQNHGRWLESVRALVDDRFVENDCDSFQIGQGIAGMVLLKNEPAIYDRRDEWETTALHFTPADLESILCVPISHDDEVEFILLLGSRRKKAFREYQLKILDLLSSYFLVSLDKARYMQEALAKSEKCALTKLYNYKYLEEKLDVEMKRFRKGELDSLSVIMMDIDHFKQVNDTYGHQSGNDILASFARLLEENMPGEATVGRYGGEEFLILLPDYEKGEALALAELIRQKIKGTPFSIVPDLNKEKRQIEVFITSSIGVSASPDDTDEAMTLLRNADRALYIGAKQAGRDRVAEYVR